MGTFSKIAGFKDKKLFKVLVGGSALSLGAVGTAFAHDALNETQAPEETEADADVLDIEGEPVVVSSDEADLADALDVESDSVEPADADTPETPAVEEASADTADSPAVVAEESPDTPDSPDVESPDTPDTPDTPDEDSPDDSPEGEDD
jgi:hypothetical protein